MWKYDTHDYKPIQKPDAIDTLVQRGVVSQRDTVTYLRNLIQFVVSHQEPTADQVVPSTAAVQLQNVKTKQPILPPTAAIPSLADDPLLLSTTLHAQEAVLHQHRSTRLAQNSFQTEIDALQQTILATKNDPYLRRNIPNLERKMSFLKRRLRQLEQHHFLHVFRAKSAPYIAAQERRRTVVHHHFDNHLRLGERHVGPKNEGHEVDTKEALTSRYRSSRIRTEDVFAVGSAEAEDSVRNLVHEWNTMMVTSMPRYRVQASDYCPKCRIPLDEVIGQPRLMCRMCGHSARIVLLTTSSLPFSSCGSGSSSVDAVDPAYARDQHFMECMNRFLARFPHAIHPDQAKSLMKDLYRQGYRQAKDIDFTTVHLTMRKLQLAGLYKHENAVVSKIVGLPAPSLTPSDVAWLRYMFRMAQAPFMSMFSNTETSRKNFLIFPYFLHKAFVLLGQWHLLDRVPLPRCVTKLRRLESIWRFICAYNGWRFVPSPAVRKRAAHANGATGNKRARKMEEAILS